MNEERLQMKVLLWKMDGKEDKTRRTGGRKKKRGQRQKQWMGAERSRGDETMKEYKEMERPYETANLAHAWNSLG